MTTCAGLELVKGQGFEGLIVFPSTCNPYFYPWFLGALFFIFTMVLFYKDQEKLPKADFISCLGVSSFAIVFLATILTLINATINGVVVPALDQTNFLRIIAFAIIFIAMWFIKK